MKFLRWNFFSWTVIFALTSKQTFAKFFLLISGFWLLHCHIDFHLDLGMGLIVQVGEISEMKPKPKNFPTCGDWEFDVSIIPFKSIILAKVASRKAQYLILAYSYMLPIFYFPQFSPFIIGLCESRRTARHSGRLEDGDRNRDTDTILHEHPFPSLVLIRTA